MDLNFRGGSWSPLYGCVSDTLFSQASQASAGLLNGRFHDDLHHSYNRRSNCNGPPGSCDILVGSLCEQEPTRSEGAIEVSDLPGVRDESPTRPAPEAPQMGVQREQTNLRG